jgi:hypothetical protein
MVFIKNFTNYFSFYSKKVILNLLILFLLIDKLEKFLSFYEELI